VGTNPDPQGPSPLVAGAPPARAFTPAVRNKSGLNSASATEVRARCASRRDLASRTSGSRVAAASTADTDGTGAGSAISPAASSLGSGDSDPPPRRLIVRPRCAPAARRRDTSKRDKFGFGTRQLNRVCAGRCELLRSPGRDAPSSAAMHPRRRAGPRGRRCTAENVSSTTSATSKRSASARAPSAAAVASYAASIAPMRPKSNSSCRTPTPASVET